MITSYKNLSIAKFDEILSFTESELSDIDKLIGVVSVLADKTDTELMQMSISDFGKLANTAKALLEQRPQKGIIPKVYHLGDWELIPNMNPQKMVTGQFVDFNEYATDEAKHKSQLMACMLIPKGCAYGKGYDIDKLKDDIYQLMPISDYYTFSSFFFDKCEKCVEASLRYSEALMKMSRMWVKLKNYLKIPFRQNGGGLKTSM